MVGTEFEALEYAEPQLFARPKPVAPKRRVLVVGAGLTGVEAARVIAGHGQDVEIWEREPRAGGQIHLAVAAPDKADVWGAWRYRWQEIETLGVPVVTGRCATLPNIQAFAPDFVVVATGALPRPTPFDLSALSKQVQVLHAWDVLGDPARIRDGACVTVIGGGMVGMEAADLLSERGVRVTVIETLPTLANGMARNNRFELLDRLRERGVTLMSETRVQKIDGERLDVLDAQGQARQLQIGEALIIAIGPRSNDGLAGELAAAGIDYALAGDAYRPGDFLSCIRDAWMIALSLETRNRTASPRQPDSRASVGVGVGVGVGVDR